jgi:hypothetical protein
LLVVSWAVSYWWTFDFWDAYALVGEAWAVNRTAIISVTIAVKFLDNLLGTSTEYWKSKWAVTVATVFTSRVSTSAGIDRGGLSAKALNLAVDWIIADLSNALNDSFDLITDGLELTLAKFAFSTWIGIPFLTNYVLSVLIDALFENFGWTDTSRVRVAVVGDFVNTYLIPAVFSTSWWSKAKSVTAVNFAWVTISKLTFAAASLGVALVNLGISTRKDKAIVFVEAILLGKSTLFLVSFTVVETWLVLLTLAVSVAAWAMWVRVDIVRFARFAHWWFIEAEFWEASTLSDLALKVTRLIKRINVVSMSGFTVGSVASVGTCWSITDYWCLWHWGWVSVYASRRRWWTRPDVTASASVSIDETISFYSNESFAVSTSWLSFTYVSFVSADNTAVVSAATSLATVSDNWVDRDDLIPEFIGFVSDTFIRALVAAITSISHASTRIGMSLESTSLSKASWWVDKWAWSWSWTLVSFAACNFSTILKNDRVDKVTGWLSLWSAFASWLKLNSKTGSNTDALFVSWAFRVDAFVSITTAKWVNVAKLLNFTITADKVVGTSEVFAALGGNAFYDFADAWLADISVLVPSVGIFVDDTVAFANWFASTGAVDLASTSVEIVGRFAYIAFLSTRDGAVFTDWAWWWTIARESWAAADWLWSTVDNVTLVSALNGWNWAFWLTDTFMLHATLIRSLNVSAIVKLLVKGTASWGWVELWVGSDTLGKGLEAWTNLSLRFACVLITALTLSGELEFFVILAIWDSITTESVVFTSIGGILITCTWLATVVILVPGLSILHSFLLIDALETWAIANLMFATALVLSWSELAALVASWVWNNWAIWIADAFVFLTAVDSVQGDSLTPDVTWCTSWHEWKMLWEESWAVSDYASLEPAFVNWAAVISIVVPNKVISFLLGTVSFGDDWVAAKGSVFMLDMVITVALVNVALVWVFPSLVLELDVTVEFACSADTLDELLAGLLSWAYFDILVDWAVFWVWTSRCWLAVGWVTLTRVSAASWTVRATVKGALWIGSPWHIIESISRSIDILDDFLLKLIKWVSAETSLGSNSVVFVTVDLCTLLDTYVRTVWVRSFTAKDSSLTARSSLANITIEDALWVFHHDRKESSIIRLLWKIVTNFSFFTDFGSIGRTVLGLKLALTSLAVGTWAGWYWILHIVFIDFILHVINNALMAIWLWSILALPNWAALSFWNDLIGYADFAGIIRCAVWSITHSWAKVTVTFAFIKVAAVIIWIWSLDVSFKPASSVTEDEVLLAVVSVTLVFADWVLASISLASTIVASGTDNLVSPTSWLGITRSVLLVPLALVFLTDTGVNDTVMFKWLRIWSIEFTVKFTVTWCLSGDWANSGWASSGWASSGWASSRWFAAASVSWAAASRCGYSFLDSAQVNIAEEFCVSWLWCAGIWTSTLLVYAHALVSSHSSDHHALVALGSLFVFTGVIFGRYLVVTSANLILFKAKSGTVVFALAWSTTYDFTTAGINGNGFVFGWITDLLFWAWSWSNNRGNVTGTVIVTLLLVALVWKINIPFVIDGFLFTVDITLAWSSIRCNCICLC